MAANTPALNLDLDTLIGSGSQLRNAIAKLFRQVDTGFLNQGSAATTKKFRGFGQGMRLASAMQGTNNQSQVCRFSIRAPIPVRRFKLLYAWFYTTGTPIRDVRFGDDALDTTGAGAASRKNIAVQCGIEYPFVENTTGFATRPAVTFAGQNYKQYTYNAAADTNTFEDVWGSTSDTFDIGQTVPAGEPIGLHCGMQLNSASPGGQAMPTNWKGMNGAFLGQATRYETYQLANTNIIAGKGAANDLALTATSYTTAFPSTGFGADAGYTPYAMLIETEEGVWEQIAVSAHGDSITAGTGEGHDGYMRGDVRGDIDGNNGWVERYVIGRLGALCTNAGRGSHGFKYVGAHPDYTKGSRKLAARTNPTHILSAYGTNDVGTPPTPSNWAGVGAYIRGQLAVNSSKVYLCIKGGTAAATVGPIRTQLREKDGTVVWRYIGTTSSEDKIQAFAEAFFMLMRDEMPNVPIIQATIGPDSTSTDLRTTVANQTASSGWGDNTSVRGKVNAKIRAGKFGADGYIDLGYDGSEYNYSFANDNATETSKWNTEAGAAYTLTGTVTAATTATLSAVWAGETSAAWGITFSDGSVRLVTLTNGSAAVSWTGAVASATANITVTMASWLTNDLKHPNSNGHNNRAQGIRGNAFLKRAA